MYNWRIHESVVPKKIRLLRYAPSFHPSFLLFLLQYRSQKARNGIKKVLMRLFKTTRSHIRTAYYPFHFHYIFELVYIEFIALYGYSSWIYCSDKYSVSLNVILYYTCKHLCSVLKCFLHSVHQLEIGIMLVLLHRSKSAACVISITSEVEVHLNKLIYKRFCYYNCLIVSAC